MGHHEANNIALTHTAIFCYERLRPRLKQLCQKMTDIEPMFPRFESVMHVLAKVPNCQQEDIVKFDAKIISAAQNASNKTGEKAKKDMFKKIVGSLAGKETARLFQKEIVIKNLPNMAPTKVKAKTPSLDEQTERNGQDTGIASLFA